MIARNETIFKWALYAGAALLCILVQGALLQRMTILGVLPFVYPLLAAIPATYEDPVPGTIFALAAGVFCDLLLPGPIPCFYTLTFPLVGLACSLLSKSLLPAGFLCSAVAGAIAFLVVDLSRCLLLWLTARPAWSPALLLMVREFCVTLPLVIPVTLLFRRVFLRTHLDD